MDMNHLIGGYAAGWALTAGSQRFNLISKSDIRYVGTLHEINPEASTIALENVVSYGTEGRRGNPAEEIAPSTSVYEYIVFRGSDVKDISVAEEEKEEAQANPPQVPDDPAILGSMSRPGPGQGPQGPPQQPPQGPRQTPPGYPQQPPQFQGFYPPYGRGYGPPPFPPGPGFPNMPYGAPPGWFPPPGQGFPQGPGQFPPPQVPLGPPGPQQQHTPPQQQRPGGGPVNPSKPTSEFPAGDKASSKPASRNVTPAPAAAAAVSVPPVESKPSVAGAVQASSNPHVPTIPAQPPTGPKNGRVIPAIPLTAASKPPVPVTNAPGVPANNVSQGTAQSAITEATRAATAAVAAAMAKLPQPGAQQKKPQQGDSNVDNLTRKMNELRPYDGSRPRGAHQQQQTRGRGGHRGQQYQGQKKIEVPDTDYDFETANARFNKQDLVKEAIASGTPAAEVEEAAAPVETVSHGDYANGEQPAPATSGVSYNKASSFFDNISSEARDREEGTGTRAGGREWRGEEEKRNIETFGQGSVDGYRSNYRGRGRGRGQAGRGRGYGRGGYTNNPRGRGNFRGRPSQATGVPAQSA
ncbi:hypothetical protein ASPZODRAFT_139212 [Penicilliopsis zonata CBS 506.65]|uniref:DFDF domain-containing protein n=1 Tax=Penicilliopsis zonata CBS 506.65 TaxID=1073090 RepID=A0A1L9SRM4_9EURO|nr:hypothetical protein ASPZODRAFT_139212 [Penicilliopsis zonata CBS 506.65]OJJ49859.1 hypothetical protein ASPZODRAFT_139212 [Penicilliopsis zonata CBS 506.65]